MVIHGFVQALGLLLEQDGVQAGVADDVVERRVEDGANVLDLISGSYAA